MDPNTSEIQSIKARSVTIGVPAKSLSTVLALVAQLQNTVGIALSRPVLADRLNTKVSSSGFMQKIAAARYYGFIELQQEKIAITPRGERFAQGDIVAAQEGFMSSAFGTVAQGLAGLSAESSTVALHLSDKHNVPQSSAERYAVVMLRSADEAGLIRNDRFDAEKLEALASVVTVEVPQKKSATSASSKIHRQPTTTTGRASNLQERPLAPAQQQFSPRDEGIKIAGGFYLSYPQSLPAELVMSEDFTQGLRLLKSAIETHSKDK